MRVRGRLLTWSFFALSSVPFVLAGCGGGGQSGAVPQVSPVTNTPTSAAKGTVSFAVSVPTKSSSAKRPAYVSPATQSMTVSVQQGSTTVVSQTIGLTPTSTGCTSSLASTTCTLQLALAAGSYKASITTYDAANGTGNVLSTARDVPFTIVANQINQVPLTLSGIPSKILVISAGATSVYVEALDVDGNFIVGAGAPAFTAANASGPAIATITQPTAAHPNLISFSPSSLVASGTETIAITANYPSGTNACSQSGAVCSLPSAITAKYTGGNVFVSNLVGNNVLGFTLPLVSATQAPAYSVSMTHPFAMTSDASGNVYVATYSTPSVLSEISPPYGAITASATLGGGNAYGIALAPNGDVVTANSSGSFSLLTSFSATPITNSNGLSSPNGVAVDSSNNVYIADVNNAKVFVFGSPYTGPATEMVSTTSPPQSALVFGNKLFVGEQGGIDVFSLPLTGGSTPVATVTSPYAIFNMTVDSSGNLWVANSGHNSVDEYMAPVTTGETPTLVLSLPASGTTSYSPSDLAFDSFGNLYVANSLGGSASGGGIIEFAAPITSSSTPAIAIETNNLSYPAFITTAPFKLSITTTP